MFQKRERSSWQIFVKLENNIAIKVNGSDKIIDLKLKLYDIIGMSKNEIDLIFQGEILDDKKTVQECEICEASVVDILAKLRGGMQIFARMINWKTIELEVSQNNKISDLKIKIHENVGLNPDEQIIYFQGNILENDKTIANYGICDKSLMDIISRSKDGIQIFAKTIDERRIAFEVSKNEKIIDIKRKIQEKIGLNEDEQKLIHRGIVLENEKTIEYYVKNGKTLFSLLIRMRDGIHILAKTIDNTTVSLEINHEYKISDIKIKIQDKIGLNADEQIMYFHDQILDNEKSIDYYGIAEKSCINIVSTTLRNGIQIFAKIIDNRTVAFNVNKTDRVSDIKTKIQEKIGLHPEEQRLVFQGGYLEDDRMINEYEMNEKSVINVLIRTRGTIQIFAKSVDGQTIAFDVNKNDKIREMKNVIHDKLGMHPDDQVICSQQGNLEDDKTLDCYGFDEKSSINVIVRLRNGIHLFVKSIDDKTASFELNKYDKISDVKHKIQEEIGLHPDEQNLHFQGQILENDKTIDESGLCEKSVIEVVSTSKNTLEIVAKTMDGTLIPVEITKTNKIRDLKAKLQEKMGLHPEEQKLVCKGHVLEDDKAIEECNLHDKSTINVVPRLRDGLQIFAKTNDGKAVTFEVSKTEKIREIKLKIQTKLKLNLNDQDLSFQEKILEDDKTVEYYGLVEKSEIHVAFKSKRDVSSIQIGVIVKTMDGACVDININKIDTISDVKNKIQEKIKVHQDDQILFHQKIPLEDQKSIVEYKIDEKSVICVVDRSKNSSIKIFAKTRDGQTTSLQVRRNTKIVDLKKRIEDLTKVRQKDQHLIYQSGILEDHKSIWEYEIGDKSEIEVFTPLRIAKLSISIRTMDGKIEELQTTKNEKIIDLKRKIEEKIGLPAIEQQFVFQKRILDNNKTVDQCKICNKSMINIVDENNLL